ncbi:MAG: hypothetical protein ACD_11C00018G0005 [uncultured bacterium]|nr:MAG: hypothetical protein ACD_11C00018G0005 [uncultured bacterium]HBR71531.1 hypothetical protein [Candidatus Moranbacteria bacterium]
MFEFTKEIQLEKSLRKIYIFSRFFVFIIFLTTGIFVAYKILFPEKSFNFSFQNINSSKNSINEMKMSNGNLYENGKIPEGKNLFFNAAATGIYSTASINFVPSENFNDSIIGEISIKKSYASFFYPDRNDLGFKNGTLLKNNVDLFIVSNDKLRKFSSPDLAYKMGFKKEAFLEVSLEDLKYNATDALIVSETTYPNNSIFRIADIYYQLQDSNLRQFVSENAYLTQYSIEQAIDKDPSFINNFTVSEDMLGFNDGTLIAAGESAYIASDGFINPIDNPATFEGMGYIWSDILQANSEEIGMYQKAKLFTIRGAHPSGTIFKNSETNEYYYIQGKTKRKIKSESILKTYLRNNPVLIENKSLIAENTCKIKKASFLARNYGCETSLDNIKNFKGNSYLFSINFEKPTEIASLDAHFNQNINLTNLKLSLLSLRNNIARNYISK